MSTLHFCTTCQQNKALNATNFQEKQDHSFNATCLDCSAKQKAHQEEQKKRGAAANEKQDGNKENISPGGQEMGKGSQAAHSTQKRAEFQDEEYQNLSIIPLNELASVFETEENIVTMTACIDILSLQLEGKSTERQRADAVTATPSVP